MPFIGCLPPTLSRPKSNQASTRGAHFENRVEPVAKPAFEAPFKLF